MVICVLFPKTAPPVGEESVTRNISSISGSSSITAEISRGCKDSGVCVISHEKPRLPVCTSHEQLNVSIRSGNGTHLCPASLINVTFFLDQLIGGRNEID